MKWNLKRTLALILCLICVLFALYKPVPIRAEGIIDQMVYYALTVSGYMKKNLLIDGVNGGGGGHQYGKPIGENDKNTQGSYILSTLRDAFQYAYDNHHINVDNSGNVTFDSTITQNFYDIVNGGSGLGGYDAKVLNGNPDFTDYANTAYANAAYVSTLPNAYSAYSEYLAISCLTDYNYPTFWIYDLSEVAYMAVSYQKPYAQLKFYNSNGENISVKYRMVMSRGDNAPYINDDRTTNVTSLDIYNGNQWVMCYPRQLGDYSWDGFKDAYFNYFPSIPVDIVYQANGPYCYYTNRPIVVGKTPNDAFQAWRYYENGSGYVNVNNYTVLPSVSNQQITNNNFQQTYNKYCDNVNTIYNTTYNDEEEFDLTAFTQIMNDQNVVIMNAINQGVTDITGTIQTTNDKLDIIIGLLEILQNSMNGGGASSDTQSAVYLQQILQYINSNPWNTSPPNIVINSTLPNVIVNNTAPNVVVNNTAPNVTVNVEADTMSAVLLREIYDYIIANPWAQSGSSVTTPEIEIPATGSAVNVLSVSSSALYANANNSGGWSMAKNTGTPTYYQIFKMDNVKSFKLSTIGGTRTRVMFTDYEPETFYDNLQIGSAFTISGTYSANLADTVTDYLIQNSSGAEYFYVYTGNDQAQVDITDIELKQATITVGGGGSGGGFTSLQAYEVIDLLRFLVNNQVTFSEFQTIMQNVLQYLSQLASSNSATYNEISDINDTLVDIYNSIVSNGNSNNPENNNYYYGDNYYTNNKNKINNDLQNYIDKLYDDYHFPDDPEPIVDAMTQVVPWCFLVMVTTLFSELATQPETPYFEIPFVIESLDYEYTVVIDFSEYDTIHDILIAGEMILFIICCIYVYFYLFKIIYDVF